MSYKSCQKALKTLSWNGIYEVTAAKTAI
ncbi:hypothetical protein B14911_26295 [Bacillus sp. NRRL B-14911]|nr:hypothetical protein B14911_26295 [Bacillus sp. NRRL B-14911]